MSALIRTTRALSVLVATAALAAGCASGYGDASPSSATCPPSRPSSAPVRPVSPVKLAVADTIATGIQVPWGLTFLPDETALVAERDSAKVKHIVGKQVTEVGTVPGVDPSSEGGLLGLAVDPKFSSRPYVYAYYSSGTDNRIARLTWRNNRIVDPHVILDGIPISAVHNGGRLRFGPDGFLYVGTGEGGQKSNSQDNNSLGGKILRITSDGEPAPGNPDPASPIFTKGHRNVQGLAFDGDQLYASEFGQNTWDELNVIDRGANYGWPAAEGISHLDCMVDPIAQWTTAEASPSGIAFAQGYIFMASLRGERLWAIPVADGWAGKPVAFFTHQFGRLRTIETAPDGSLWLTTSNTDGRGKPRDGDDRILRITITR
jgi:glucose/arabinose dehydrogenase